MTSKTNQEIRKDVSRFSGLCLLYTLAMSAVVTVYSIVTLLIFIYQYGGDNLRAAKEAASQFLANDGYVSLCGTSWPLDFLVIS